MPGTDLIRIGDDMEPLNILLNYFDIPITLVLRSGPIVTGKFVKYSRNTENEAEWRFVDEQYIQNYERNNDLRITRRISNSDILGIEKIGS